MFSSSEMLWAVCVCVHTAYYPFSYAFPLIPSLLKNANLNCILLMWFFVLKLWGGGVKNPRFWIFNVQVWEPDFPQAIFSNQLLWKIFFIVLLFLAFLEFKEIKSNGFIVIPHVFSRMLRFLLICCKFSNMTVALSYRRTLEAYFKDVCDGRATSRIHIICWWCPLGLRGACMGTMPSHPFVGVCAAFPRPSVLSLLEQFLSLKKKRMH